VRYVIPALEIVLVGLLAIPASRRRLLQEGLRRLVSIVLIALIGLGNAIALGFLINQLLYGGGVQGRSLLFAAFDLWVTNVIVFALWYWELDGGGPVRRERGLEISQRDFFWTQMNDEIATHEKWQPLFADYLYLAFTNASAFSPTDTMPLTRNSKMLMLLQSALSIVTLLLVAARAVNILNG
jgi:hypothetical protein